MYYSIAYNNNMASISDDKFCLKVYNRERIDFIHSNQVYSIRFVNLPISLIVIKSYKNDFIRLANKLLNTICIPELFNITRRIENVQSM